MSTFWTDITTLIQDVTNLPVELTPQMSLFGLGIGPQSFTPSLHTYSLLPAYLLPGYGNRPVHLLSVTPLVF